MTRLGGAILYAGLLVPTLILAACSTFVTSKPKDNDETGIEYALCLPVLTAEPQPNGLVKFTPGCLPDPEHRYVVSGSTLLGNLTLDIVRNLDMTLNSVTIDRDDSAVAVEATKAVAAIRQKQLEVRAAAEKRRRDAEKAALDAAKKSADDAEAALKTARATVDQALTALKDARRKLESLVAVHGLTGKTAEQIYADPDVRLEVKMAVRTASHFVDEKQDAFDLASRVLGDAEEAEAVADARLRQTASSGNVPAEKGPTIWGPLVYAVRQEVDDSGKLSVSLVALFEQPELGTAAPVARVEASASGVDNTVVSIAPDARTGAHVFAIALREKADEIAGIRVQSADDPSVQILSIRTSLSADGREIAIGVGPGVAPGVYRVLIVVKNAGKEQEFLQTVKLTGPTPAR